LFQEIQKSFLLFEKMKIAASIFAAATAQYGAYPNDGAYNDGYNPGKVKIIKKKFIKTIIFQDFFSKKMIKL